MRCFSLNGALFMFVRHGEKLTDDAIGNVRWGPGERYVIWPRSVYWDVRFKKVGQGKLEWLPISDKPFASSDDAWQAAYADWEQNVMQLQTLMSAHNKRYLSFNRQSIFLSS